MATEHEHGRRLSAFIAARLDEEDLDARSLGGSSWESDGTLVTAGPLAGDGQRRIIAETNREAFAEWAAVRNPARTLREVTALRAIMALHEPNTSPWPGTACLYCGHLWPCAEPVAIAAIWSEHPDYLDAAGE